MKNPTILARCNLFGVLKNLECLSQEDEEFKKLANTENITIQFLIKNGPRGQIEIKDGNIRVREGKFRSNAILYFSSPDHFNRMIDGDANPIPLKGFTRLKFLTGTFGRMTDILGSYMRLPENEEISKKLMESNTTLIAYTAFSSLAEIANHDPIGIACAKTIPNGVIQISIMGGPGVKLTITNGVMVAERGYSDDPRAILQFKDSDSAFAILNDKIDTFTSLALGNMEMRGFIPMIEHMNPILDRVSYYLN